MVGISFRSAIAASIASDASAEQDLFTWRPADISASIVTDDRWLDIGHYVRLRQALRSDESGWREMKLDIPDDWWVAIVGAVGERVLLKVDGGSSYALSKDNVGELSFRILDGGERHSDEDLGSIWRQLAAADSEQ
jgi:hypothetical protein